MSSGPDDPRPDSPGPDIVESPQETPATQTEDQSEDLCRICRCDGEDDPLFQPCLCSGSIQSVHEQCLLTWLDHRGHDACEVCGEKYTFAKKYRDDMPETLPLSAYLKSLGSLSREVMAKAFLVIRSIIMVTCTLDVILAFFSKGTALAAVVADSNNLSAFFTIFSDILHLRVGYDARERPWLFDNPSWIEKSPAWRHLFASRIDGLTVAVVTFVVLMICYMTLVWVLSDTTLLHDISHLADGQPGHLDPGGTKQKEGFWTDAFYFESGNANLSFGIEGLNERARIGLIKEANGELVEGELEHPSYGSVDGYLEKIETSPELSLDADQLVEISEKNFENHGGVENPNWGPQVGWAASRLRIEAPTDTEFPRNTAEMLALAWGFDEFTPRTAFPSKAASSHFGIYFEALMVEWQRINNSMLTEQASASIDLMRKLSQRKIAIELEVNELSQIAKRMGEEGQRADQIEQEARLEAAAQGLGDEPNDNPPIQEDARWVLDAMFGGPFLEKLKWYGGFLVLLLLVNFAFFLSPMILGRSYRRYATWAINLAINRFSGSTLETDSFSHLLIETWRDVTETQWLSPPVGFAAEFLLGCSLIFMLQYWVYYFSLNWLLKKPEYRIIAITLKRSTACASIVTVFAVELIAFPIYSGVLLHLALLPLVENSAAFTPVATFENSPHLSVVGWHLFGLLYVYAFGAFLRMVRAVLRVGALYFVQDPTDPTSQPVKMILTQGLVSHMRKVIVSMCLYILFLLGGVGLPAFFTRFTGLLPNIIAPLRLNYINASEYFSLWPLVVVLITYRDTLKQQCTAGWKWQRQVWDNYIKQTARSVGLKSFLLNEPESISLRNSGKGDFIVAPRCGQFERSKKVKLFTSIENLDAGRWYGSKMAAGFHARYVIVWRPKDFRLRVAMFITCLWTAATVEVALFIVVPLLIARTFMSFLGCEDAFQNDLLRIVICWPVILIGSSLFKRQNADGEPNDEDREASEEGTVRSTFTLSLLDAVTSTLYYGTMVHLLSSNDTSFWRPSLSEGLYLLAYMLWLWPSKEPASLGLCIFKIAVWATIQMGGHLSGLQNTDLLLALTLLIPFFELKDTRPRFLRDLVARWPERARSDVYLVRNILLNRPRPNAAG